MCLRKGTYIYLHFIQIRCSEIFVKHYAFKLGTKVYQITPTFDTNHSLFKPPLNSVPSSFLDSSLQESVNCSNQYHSITVCVWKKSSCTQETTTAQQKKTCLTKKGERVDATFERSACCAILPRIVNHFTHFHARTSTHTQTHTQGLVDRRGSLSMR